MKYFMDELWPRCLFWVVLAYLICKIIGIHNPLCELVGAMLLLFYAYVENWRWKLRYYASERKRIDEMLETCAIRGQWLEERGVWMNWDARRHDRIDELESAIVDHERLSKKVRRIECKASA